MEIRAPLIAILISIILIVIFLRRGLPQILGSKIFFSFLIVVFFCNLCEILECVVFLYLDDSFSALRKVSQGLYVGMLVASAYVMCVYVYAKTTLKRRVSALATAIAIAHSIVAYLALALGDVSYGFVDGHYYNYGGAVRISYLVGFTYIFISLLRVLVLRARIPKEDALSIIAGLIIWAILALFQFIVRDIQVSSMAMTLMSLILFISLENPREYYERSLEGVRNRDAFHMVLAEKMGQKKTFFIISVIFTGKTAVMTSSDRNELAMQQIQLGKLAESYIGSSAYLFNWNTLSFIVDSPQKAEAFMTLVNGMKDGGKNYRQTFCILEVPKYVKTLDESVAALTYVSGEYIYTQSTPNLVIDDAVIDKMNYRNTIEDVVRQAVKDKAFDVYYQPILCVADGSFSSAEALVRLKRKDNESYISPEDFIPVAEKCGLIQEIDDLVFEKVCSFIARENLSSYGVRMVEVNLSGNEAVDENTHLRLTSKMEKYHIPPKFINFEITETSYISNDEAFKENVNRLQERGSSFSMDDFGSGYSNLLEILKMDYALVKLDKEFVWNCLDKEKPENMRMLDYTIGFLRDFGLHILAEGIETLDQAKILIEKKVEYLQGFYYSRPVPEADYIEFLKSQKGLFSKE